MSTGKCMYTDALSAFSARVIDDEKASIEREDTNEEPDWKDIVKLSEGTISWPFLNSDDAYRKQSSKDLCQEPSKESTSFPSSGGGSDEQNVVDSLEESSSQLFSDDNNENKGNELPIDMLNGEWGQEFSEVPFEESVSQPPLDTENSSSRHELEAVQSNSNEKKRALILIVGDSDPSQSYCLAKKCKPDQSLDNAGSPAADFQTTDDFQQKENSGGSGKRRRCGWDVEAKDGGEHGEGDKTSKRRKTRWADDSSLLKMLGPIQLPNFVKQLARTNSDPEVQKLKLKLLEINRKLHGAEVHDEKPLGKICLPPVHDNFEVRIHPRNAKFYEKLVEDRQDVIARLIKKNPTFKLPSEYKPPKLYKKLYIPLKEYPGYNFVGLIIGPRGNTQKRMEKETGAKIVLRGKGSMKEKKALQIHDPSDNDDLHVLVEADNQKSLDEAVKMIEKLLIPVAEGMNEHKRAQLRELAKLNGTLRDENLCKTSGEEGHKQCACPCQSSTFLNIDVSCGECGANSRTRVNCSSSLSTPCRKLGDQYHSFPSDMEGGGFTVGAPPASTFMPWGFGTSTSYSSYSHPGLCLTPNKDSKPIREAENANLFVGNLPPTVDENHLMGLFSPFGRILEAKVIKDHSTGFSKGYGFVKYDNSIGAATAVAHMKGYKIDGKMLAMRVAGHLPTTGYSSVDHLAKYPCPAMIAKDSPSQVVWPCPPRSIQSEPQSSSTEREDPGLPPLSVFLGHTDPCSEQYPPPFRSPYYIPISSPCSLAKFSRNPHYSGSPSQSYFVTPENNVSRWFHPPHPFVRHLIPIPCVPTCFPVRIPQP